jgi:hypothetical protein
MRPILECPSKSDNVLHQREEGRDESVWRRTQSGERKVSASRRVAMSATSARPKSCSERGIELVIREVLQYCPALIVYLIQHVGSQENGGFVACQDAAVSLRLIALAPLRQTHLQELRYPHLRPTILALSLLPRITNTALRQTSAQLARGSQASSQPQAHSRREDRLQPLG